MNRYWPICFCLAAVLALAASPHAFADPETKLRMKPVIEGFIDMQTIAWHNTDGGRPDFTLQNVKQFPGMFGGIVLNATWAEMQHRAGGPLKAGRIDQALERVRAYNAEHPEAPLGVKLRIFAGNEAPEWAKEIGGPPLTIQRNPQGCSSPGNCPITIGRVWDPQYIDAWRAFQDLVADRYDSEPLIRSVAITSCTMETDEPFVMPADQPAPAGYTDAAGKECLRGAVDDYAAWRRTAIDFTFNVFHRIQKGGFDPDFSKSVMRGCRAALGSRCELGNHAFNGHMPLGNLQIVEAISEKGGPIHYQTTGPRARGFGWTSAIRAARQYNATAIELWPDKEFGGFTTRSQREMRGLRDQFDGIR